MQRIASGADVAAAAADTALLAQAHVVLDARDWRIIPAENLIAAFQARRRHPTLTCQQRHACVKGRVPAAAPSDAWQWQAPLHSMKGQGCLPLPRI